MGDLVAIDTQMVRHAMDGDIGVFAVSMPSGMTHQSIQIQH